MGMTDTPYNIPPLGLFGKRCRILRGYDKRPFVYRIVNSEWMSNTWCEPPITYQSERNPVRHDHSENVLIVVLDTLIDENSRLIRVALKDVELMDEVQDNAGWIGADNRPPSQGRYLVYGLTNFVPDHIDQPNAYWEVKIAYWSNRFGWDCKVKYWMPPPEPPKGE